SITPATPHNYTLSLHDALPIFPGLKPYQPNQSSRPPQAAIVRSCGSIAPPPSRLNVRPSRGPSTIAPASATNPPIVCTTRRSPRSEEHTSELQSRSDLVCRLLL